MPVNSYILSEYLSDCLRKKIRGNIYDTPITYATIYNPLIEIKSDAVYIVTNVKDFPTYKTDVISTFIVIGELKKEIMVSSQHSIICFNSEYHLSRLYERVVTIINSFNEWETRLNEILLNGGGIEEICEESINIIDNPMYIITADYRVLSVAEKQENFINSIKDENCHLCEEKMLKLLAYPERREGNNKIGFSIYPDRASTTLKMSIYQNNKIWGYICMEDIYRPFIKADFTKLCIIYKYLQKCIEISYDLAAISHNKLKSVLSDYIFTKNNDPKILREAILSANWKINDEFFCTVIHLSTKYDEYETIGILSAYIEHKICDVVSIISNNILYILCNKTRNETDIEKWKDILLDIKSNFDFYAGVSLEFKCCYDIKDYFIQAEKLVAFYEKRNQKPNIYTFENSRLEYIIGKGTDSLPLKVLMTGNLKMFLDEDAKNNFENYRIVRSYVMNNLNIAETVNELFLHRSSLVYRLEKIKKNIGTDFTNKDELMYYKMIFYAIDAKIAVSHS